MQAPNIVTNFGLKKLEEIAKKFYFYEFIIGKNFSDSQKKNLLDGLVHEYHTLTIAENAEISPKMATDFLEGYEIFLENFLRETQIVRPHGLHGYIDIDDVFYTPAGLLQLVSIEPETDVDTTLHIDINNFNGRTMFLKALGESTTGYGKILGIHKPESYKEILTMPDKGRKLVQRQDVVSMYCQSDDSFHVAQIGAVESINGINYFTENDTPKIMGMRIGDEYEDKTIVGSVNKNTLIKRLTQYSN